MRTTLLLPAALAALAVGVALQGDDKAAAGKDDKAALYGKMAQGPAGMRKAEIEKDRLGRITALYVVGRADITTVLGTTKGIKRAEERAVNDAKIKFLQWLREDAAVRLSEDNEVVVITEGEQEEGKEAARKTGGKAVERNTTRFETVSRGLIRGLQVVYYEQDGKGKLYTVVMRWTAEHADAARATERDQKNPDNTPRPDDGKRPRKKDDSIPSKKGVLVDD